MYTLPSPPPTWFVRHETQGHEHKARFCHAQIVISITVTYATRDVLHVQHQHENKVRNFKRLTASLDALGLCVSVFSEKETLFSYYR